MPHSRFIPSSLLLRDSCTRACRGCPEVGHCLAPKALLQPIPRSMWLLAGLAVVVPVVAASYVRQYMREFEWLQAPPDEVLGDLADERVAEHYRGIMRSVGIAHPERIAIRETHNLGPMVVGVREQGIMYVPRLMVQLADPSLAMCITDPDTEQVVFDGTVGDMTAHDRETILERGGPLLPEARELDYIIGHEAAHLKHDDTARSAVVAAGSVVLAHVSLKLYNQTVHRLRWPAALAVRGIMPYSLLVGAMASLTVLAAGVLEEMHADMESARQLQCADAALHLVEKKLQQNRVSRAMGLSSTITASGNDLSAWRHPPLTMQRRYLQWIADQQHRRHQLATGSLPAPLHDESHRDELVTLLMEYA